MKRTMLVLLAVMSLFPGVADTAKAAEVAAVQNSPSLKSPESYLPGEVLVKRVEGSTVESTRSILSGMGARVVESFGALGIDRVQLPETMGVEAAVRDLEKDPAVLFAEPNFTRRIQAIPNDEFFLSHQWGLHNTGQAVGGVAGAADADIDAPEAWDITTGSRDVVVAVIDTGVDFSQPDLAPNLWRNRGEGSSANGVDDDGNGYVDDIHGWDFRYNDATPEDANGHGSHVAGIVGAAGNDGYGTAGVCWRVSLMILKITDNEGVATVADEIRALQYAHAKGAHVINMSLGNYTYSQAEKEAIDFNQQAVVVCAAGNEGTNNEARGHYPSSYPGAHIVSVAASDPFDNLASFSNYGSASVDLAAPGANILSSINQTHIYELKSGTSMATPMVSGVAALILSLGGRSPAEVIGLINTTVDTKPGLQGVTRTGGRLNAYKALSAAGGSTGDDDDDDGGGCFISAIHEKDGNFWPSGAVLLMLGAGAVAALYRKS